MTELSRLKARYLGHEKNPFHQFNRLMSATAELPAEVSADEKKFSLLLEDLRSSRDRNAPRELLGFKILYELQKSDECQWREEYLNFLSNLKKSHYWIENTLRDYRDVSEIENTIFAPQPFHFYDTLTAQKIDQHAKLRTFRSSKERLTTLLMQLNSQLSKEGQTARIQSLLMKPHLVDALSEIQYEVTDNAYWHALKTSANYNYQESMDEKFFGDILYLQFHNFSRTNVPTVKIGREWPEVLESYVRSYSEKFQQRDTRFIMTSFIDNGPGILEHVRRYSGSLVTSSLTVSEIIQQRITTRDVPGAGEGLSRVLRVVSELKGLLILTSGSTRYIFSGLTEEGSEDVVDSSRGTMVTVIIPV